MTPKIVFLHFPKTAGSTYRHILLGSVNATRAISAWHRLEHVPDEGQEMLHGHLLYEQIAPYRERAFLVTLMRHPVERVISYYQHVRSRPDDPNHQMAMGSSFVEFVERGAGSQTYLAQLTGHIDRSGERPRRTFNGNVRERLEVAKERLGEFDHVGITERLNESVACLSNQLGWSDVPEVPRINASARRSLREDLDQSTIDAILHRSWPDVALYDHAVELLNAQIRSAAP